MHHKYRFRRWHRDQYGRAAVAVAPSGDVLCPASGGVETVDPLNGVIHVYDANLLVRGSSVRRHCLLITFLMRLRESLPTSHLIVVATLTMVNFSPPVRGRNVDGARYPRLVDELGREQRNSSEYLSTLGALCLLESSLRLAKLMVPGQSSTLVGRPFCIVFLLE